jgi:hypothetical protein
MPPLIISGNRTYTPEELVYFFNNDLGGLVRHLRLKAGFKEVSMLTEKTGISRDRVYGLEYRSCCLNPRDLEKLSVALNRPRWYLPFVRKQNIRTQLDNRARIPDFFSTNEMHRLEIESLKGAHIPDSAGKKNYHEFIRSFFWEVKDILEDWKEYGFSKQMVQAFYLFHYKDGYLREKRLASRDVPAEARKKHWWIGPYSHEGILMHYRRAVQILRKVLTEQGCDPEPQ